MLFQLLWNIEDRNHLSGKKFEGIKFEGVLAKIWWTKKTNLPFASEGLRWNNGRSAARQPGRLPWPSSFRKIPFGYAAGSSERAASTHQWGGVNDSPAAIHVSFPLHMSESCVRALGYACAYERLCPTVYTRRLIRVSGGHCALCFPST